MRLLFVRHGESTWNLEGRYQGRMDPPLSGRGQAQARSLADRLAAEQKSEPVERRLASIISSPLTRAHETARYCATALDLDLCLDENLTEISHGEWEGLVRGEVASRWPEMLAQWRASPYLVRFPGGEMLEEVELRMLSFLNQLRSTTGAMLAVTHDVIVRIAILRATGKELSAFNEVVVDNAAITEFETSGTALTLTRRNDTKHLGSLRSDTRAQAL